MANILIYSTNQENDKWYIFLNVVNVRWRVQLLHKFLQQGIICDLRRALCQLFSLQKFLLCDDDGYINQCIKTINFYMYQYVLSVFVGDWVNSGSPTFSE